jgi:hypothetical protein
MNFDHQNLGLYMVDNTNDDGQYLNRLQGLGIEAIHIDPLPSLHYTVDFAWHHILRKARQEEYEYIISLEVDVIGPPNTASLLLQIAQVNGAVLVRHAYPERSGRGYMCCLGCQIMKTEYFVPDWSGPRVDAKGVPWHEEKRFMQVAMATGLPVLDVYNYLDLVHLHEEGPIQAVMNQTVGVQIDPIC